MNIIRRLIARYQLRALNQDISTLEHTIEHWKSQLIDKRARRRILMAKSI